MNIVLDACAVIAFLRGEPGAPLVRDALAAPEQVCFLHGINACEVYYDYGRTAGQEIARQVIQDLLAIKISIRSDMDVAFWQVAGDYKARFRRISLADCIAIALSERLNATLLTSDRKEFEPIAQLGICPIQFIR